jgi:hypothetical protein
MSNVMSNTNLNSNTKSMPIPFVSKKLNHETNNKSHLHVRLKEQSTYQICR